jgi:hypothetical protein
MINSSDSIDTSRLRSPQDTAVQADNLRNPDLHKPTDLHYILSSVSAFYFAVR